MAQTTKDEVARHAVLIQLNAAHDKFAQKEQRAVERGDYVEAQVHHMYVQWIVRAYAAEADDPAPA
jgi:hypothetical protein